MMPDCMVGIGDMGALVWFGCGSWYEVWVLRVGDASKVVVNLFSSLSHSLFRQMMQTQNKELESRNGLLSIRVTRDSARMNRL